MGCVDRALRQATLSENYMKLLKGLKNQIIIDDIVEIPADHGAVEKIEIELTILKINDTKEAQELLSNLSSGTADPVAQRPHTRHIGARKADSGQKAKYGCSPESLGQQAKADHRKCA